MNKPIYIAVGIGLAVASRGYGAVASDILPPSKRTPSVELAARLAKVATPTPVVVADLKHPFFPSEFNQVEEVPVGKTPSNKSDIEVLETIAANINVSGIMERPNGESILLIRQKKLKVGDHLTITLDDRDFEVEITDIKRTSYSLRLHDAEITRSTVTKLGKPQ